MTKQSIVVNSGSSFHGARHYISDFRTQHWGSRTNVFRYALEDTAREIPSTLHLMRTIDWKNSQAWNG